MTAFTYRMPAGIPGEVNRIWSAIIETQMVTPSGTTGAPTNYGVPMVIDATTGNVGNMRTILASDEAGGYILNQVPYGVLVRPFPTGGSQDPLGTSTPPASGPVDILKSGYINVLLSGSAAAAKGGLVYIWAAASAGTHVLGGWEAAATVGSTIAVTGAYFTGAADASGQIEIAFNV